MRLRHLALASLIPLPWLIACDHDQPLQPSIEAAAVGASGLKAPSGTDAKPSNSTTIAITWADNSTNELGFRIERGATGTGPWTTAGTTGPNVTSFSDGGRTAEQQVCYRVVAFKRGGNSSPSNTDCTTPPAAPSNLMATVLDHVTVDLAWTDNSGMENGYEVRRATAEAGPYVVVASLPANAVSFRNTELTTNTTYWYRVRATRDGGFGDLSNAASATPIFVPPTAPSGTNATPWDGYVALAWIDNATNESGFRVERSTDGAVTWASVTLTGPNVTASQDYGVAIEQPACYHVIAFNNDGDSPPSNTDCTAHPAAPSNLTGTGLSAPAIDLSWTDNSALEDGFQVERYGSGVIATLPANTTSYRDVGVSSDVTYQYVVRATKDGGVSANSNVVQLVVATVPPAAPSGAYAFPYASTEAVVTWIDNATNETGFRVERSTDGGASWVAADTVWVNVTSFFYDVGQPSEPQQLCYRVIAFNNLGDSPPSNAGCTTLPLGPTNLVVTDVDVSTIDLAWSDNSAVEDGYEVWECWPEEGNCFLLVTLDANTTSWRYYSSNYGRIYYVVATKDSGHSDPSNEVRR